jgi:predicted GNAT superfamily acetyltransferase
LSRSGFTIRPLDGYAEMKRAVEFQRVIWGANFTELVPAVMFWAAARTGGIVAGAFDSANDMAGIIFGITGWDGDRPIHWSDMLGVHPSARGRGLGLALKHYQRDRLLEMGITRVNWTFDPLEARNAHINFARLGCSAREYIRDAYGASTSPLHRGIGTDRLVADWRLDSDRVRSRMEDVAPPRGMRSPTPPDASAWPGTGAAPPALGAAAPPARPQPDEPVINPAGEPDLELDQPRIWLRIPAQIHELKERDEVAARRWREHTRAAFETYFGRGYEARDVVRVQEGAQYLLVRE